VSHHPLFHIKFSAFTFFSSLIKKKTLYGRYQVDRPSYDDRLRYFNVLFESLLSLQMEESRSESKRKKSAVDLPKAPKEVEGPNVSELITKAEAEQHAVRRMRMCLRDICNRSVIYSFVQLYHFVLTN
jgi:ATPase family AAA domain-containing protein 2